MTPGLETLDEDVVGPVEDEAPVCVIDKLSEAEAVAAELVAATELLAADAEDMMEAYPIRNAPK